MSPPGPEACRACGGPIDGTDEPFCRTDECDAARPELQPEPEGRDDYLANSYDNVARDTEARFEGAMPWGHLGGRTR